MRRAAKVDSNHRDIVEALVEAGASVTSLAPVGGGCPDLLVGYRGVNYLMEVKDATGSFTARQKEWHKGWRGVAHVVRTPDHALLVIGA